jgi:phosphoglycerate kinase
LPTIRFLLEQNIKLIICSHLGRPDGKPDPKLSLFAVAKRLRELLKHDVMFVPDCVGERVEKVVNELSTGQILLLENLRFHPEEEQNDDGFAAQLAGLAEVFVQDGFGIVHEVQASTVAVTRHLPSVAGFLLEKEVDTITNVMEKPVRPLVAVIGGAKIVDKISIINRFVDIADMVVVGGAMANTFLLAQGVDVAKSIVEPDEVPVAKQIMERAKQKSANQPFVFYVPQDGVVAKSPDKSSKTRVVDWSAHVFSEVESYPKTPDVRYRQLEPDDMVLDIGPFSGAFIAGSLQLANTVVWNGTMGVTETVGLQGPVGPFAHGTELVIEAILGQFGHRPFSLVGGGDTVGYIENRRLVDSFDHVSTGGGASLKLMAGKDLPGLTALLDKEKGQE